MSTASTPSRTQLRNYARHLSTKTLIIMLLFVYSFVVWLTYGSTIAFIGSITALTLYFSFFYRQYGVDRLSIIIVFLFIAPSSCFFDAQSSNRIFLSGEMSSGTNGFIIRAPFLHDIQNVRQSINLLVPSTEERITIDGATITVVIPPGQTIIIRPDPDEVFELYKQGKNGRQIEQHFKNLAFHALLDQSK